MSDGSSENMELIEFISAVRGYEENKKLNRKQCNFVYFFLKFKSDDVGWPVTVLILAV